MTLTDTDRDELDTLETMADELSEALYRLQNPDAVPSELTEAGRLAGQISEGVKAIEARQL